MKSTWVALLIAIVSVSFALPSVAQDHGGGKGPPPGDRRGPGPGGPGGHGGPDGAGGPGGPGGPDGGAQFRDVPMRQFDMMRGYIDLVDRFSRLSRDPSTAGVAAVISAADLLKPRGADAAIEYFNKMLPEVKSEAVQRAIRIQLVELYKNAGQQDKALEQLDVLIKGAPADAGAPKQ
jgi:hypothetical protein